MQGFSSPQVKISVNPESLLPYLGAGGWGGGGGGGEFSLSFLLNKASLT